MGQPESDQIRPAYFWIAHIRVLLLAMVTVQKEKYCAGEVRPPFPVNPLPFRRLHSLPPHSFVCPDDIDPGAGHCSPRAVRIRSKCAFSTATPSLITADFNHPPLPPLSPRPGPADDQWISFSVYSQSVSTWQLCRKGFATKKAMLTPS